MEFVTMIQRPRTGSMLSFFYSYPAYRCDHRLFLTTLVFFLITVSFSCVTELPHRTRVTVTAGRIYPPVNFLGEYRNGDRIIRFQRPPDPAFLSYTKDTGFEPDRDQYDIIRMENNPNGSITFVIRLSSGYGPMLERTFIKSDNNLEEEDLLWRKTADSPQ